MSRWGAKGTRNLISETLSGKEPTRKLARFDAICQKLEIFRVVKPLDAGPNQT